MDALQSRLITLSTFTLNGPHRTNFYIFPDLSLLFTELSSTRLVYIILCNPPKIWRQFDNKTINLWENGEENTRLVFYLDIRCIRNRSTRITVVTDGIRNPFQIK